MPIIGSFIKLLAASKTGFISNPLISVFLWSIISVLDYFWFSSVFTTLPPLVIFWGWEFLLTLIGSTLGWILAAFGLNLSPMLAIHNNILFNIVTLGSLALQIIPAIAYMNFPLPWNFIVAGVLILTIEFGSYFVTRLLVARHIEKTVGTAESSTTGAFRDKPILGNYFTDMVFLRVGDITVTWVVCIGFVIILHLFQFLLYATFLGSYPYNELWTQFIACGGLLVYVLLIVVFLPKPSGGSFLKTLTGKINQQATKQNDYTQQNNYSRV
jgi:hypothetical protein